MEALPVKTPLYATLVALVKDEPGLVPLLVEDTKREMERCAAQGRHRALRLLARFVAALVDMRVLCAAAVDTVFDALLALAADARAHADALYAACLLLFWSDALATSPALPARAARVAAAATAADAAVPALAQALAVVRPAAVSDDAGAAWRAQQAASSFLSLRPFAPFAAAAAASENAAAAAPADFGALVLRAERAGAAADSVRAHAGVPALCADAPALAPFDAVLYADCAHGTLAELLDDPAVCARHVAALVPLAPHAVAAFDAHLACTLLGALVAAPAAPTQRAARLLGAVLSRVLHGAAAGPAQRLHAARTALLARLDTLDPHAVVRLAAWTATDLCEARTTDTAGWNWNWNWAETVVPLLGSEEGKEGGTPAGRLFVAALLRECCALDVPRAFAAAPGFPRVLAARCPPADGVWPAHLRTVPASQRLLSKLATTCAPAELRALAAACTAERVADCVVRVCAMSYLNCVHVLNVQHATIAAAAGSAALAASVRRCCGRSPALRRLLLDKMTTAGLVTLADAVDVFLAPQPPRSSDEGDEMTDQKEEQEEEQKEEQEEDVPWDVLDMVVEKCVVVHSPAGAQAVARCREYAERVAPTDAFAGAVAASYAAHWELLLQQEQEQQD